MQKLRVQTSAFRSMATAPALTWKTALRAKAVQRVGIIFRKMLGKGVAGAIHPIIPPKCHEYVSAFVFSSISSGLRAELSRSSAMSIATF